jgi:hypothetical protein
VKTALEQQQDEPVEPDNRLVHLIRVSSDALSAAGSGEPACKPANLVMAPSGDWPTELSLPVA